MKAHKLLVAAGAALLMQAATAYADAITVTGNYGVSIAASAGRNPGITDDLPSPFSFSATSPLSTTNFFTVAPPGSCGSGCKTESKRITVDFTFADNTGGTGSLDVVALFQARYGGTALSCSGGAGGMTACLDWGGAGTSPTGSVTDEVTLSDNAAFSLTFYNAGGWNMTPQIADRPPAIPEPSSLILSLTGLASFGLIGLLRRRAGRRSQGRGLAQPV